VARDRPRDAFPRLSELGARLGRATISVLFDASEVIAETDI